MPEIGKRAPAFTLPNQDGEKVALKDLKGQNVVLYFYPKDLTPGCTTESDDFNKLRTQFAKQNTVILGVSRDPIERHQKFIDKLKLKFDLLSDENGKICEKYGVWQEKKLYGKTFMGIVRSTFVINEDGKIENIYEKVKVKDHAKKVLEFIKSEMQ